MTAPSLALLWMVWAGPLYPAEVGEAAKGILAADTFAFCHEADFPLTDDEAKWCPVLASDSSRCPAMVDACKALRAELDYPAGGRQATSRRTIEGEGGVKGEGGGKGGGEKMRDDDEPCIEGSSASCDPRPSTGDAPPVEASETDTTDTTTTATTTTTSATSGGVRRQTSETAGNETETGETVEGETGETGVIGETGEPGETGLPGDKASETAGTVDPESNESDASDDPQAEDNPLKKPDNELRRTGNEESETGASTPSETQSSLGAVFFWIVLIGGALAILMLLLRQRVGHVDEDLSEVDEDDEPAIEDEKFVESKKRSAVARLRDVNALLARAEEVGAAGDYGQAIRDCHAALLRSLEHAEFITIVRSRTNGEYVRDLAGRTELQGQVRAVMGDVERAQFGTQAPDKDIFSRVLGRVRKVVRSGLTGVALLATATTVVFACTQSSRGEWKSYSWSYGPAGHTGLIELARKYDISLAERTAPIEMLEPETSTLIVLRGASPEAKEWERIEDWVRKGGKLIVTGGIGRFPDWVGAHHRSASAEVWDLSVTEAYWANFGEPKLRVPGRDRLEVDGARPMLVDGSNVYAAAREVDRGEVVSLADDALLTNAALTTGDDAAFTLALLESFGGSAEYIDGSSWAGASTPFEAIGRTELLPALLQALALLLLFYLGRGILFGAPRDPARRSRRAFSQHVEAVGTHYARARVSRHALRLYASWAMGQLRDRAGAGHRKGLLPLAQKIAERSGRDETEIMRILVEGHAATQEALAHNEPGASDLENLKLMRELAKLVVGAGGAR